MSEKEASEIVLTDEAVEAGAHVLRERRYGEPIEDVVRQIFWVMVAASERRPVE